MSLRRGLDSRIRENGCDRRTANLDSNPVKGVAYFRVAPTEVLGIESDDERADVVSIARSTGSASLRRAVILLGGKPPEPFQERVGPHNLAARAPFLGRQGLALERQPSSLVVGERDSRPTGLRQEDLRCTRTSSWRYSTLRAIRSLIA